MVAGPRSERLFGWPYFSWIDPETVTLTMDLPASIGTGASDIAALASMAITRG